MGNLEVAQCLHDAMAGPVIFRLSALPCLIPCFTLHVYNTAATTPGFTSMFQAQKKKKSQDETFFLSLGSFAFLWWERILTPRHPSTSRWLEPCHVTTPNCKGGWEIEGFFVFFFYHHSLHSRGQEERKGLEVEIGSVNLPVTSHHSHL